LLDVAANRNARVRSGPGTQNSQIASLPGGETAQADGRNEAGDWLRVKLEDGTSGWVSTELLDVTGDASTLAVVEGVEIGGTVYGPMQAFYFTSGIGNPQCDEAPADGVLIQTPEGAGQIDLLVNEVQIGVGSTIYLTAQPSGVMTAAVLEGQIRVTSAGTTVVVPAGAQATIPLDENSIASGTPVLEPYNEAELVGLNSVLSALPEAITIAPALTPEILNTPHSGQWQMIVSNIDGDCRVEENEGDTSLIALVVDAGQLTLGEIAAVQSGENTYAYTLDANRSFTLQFASGYTAVQTGTYTYTYTVAAPVNNAAAPTSPEQARVQAAQARQNATTATCTTTVVSNLIYQGE
jgi:hypothetical protein